MGLTFGINSASLSALRQLEQTSSSLGRSFERLSSGMRINRASDDAAGLAISSSLSKDARVYSQAIRNANDGISALSLASEALGNATNILIRLRELATQSANGSLSRTQRLSLDDESEALTSEFNRMVASVDFNGLKLMNGQFGRMTIQVGYGDQGSIGFNIGAELDRNIVAGYDRLTSITASSGGHAQSNPLLVDFNNDGKLDLTTVSASNLEIHVLLGNGDGTFAAVSTYAFSQVSGQHSAADINQDGILDLVTGGATNFAYRLGVGDGTFGAEISISAGGSVNTKVAVGDLNGDGIVDLIGGSSGASRLYVRLGLGGGAFAGAVGFDTGAAVRGFSMADLNNDGRSDVIVKDNSSSSMSISLGTAAGLGTATAYSGIGNATGLAVGDIDYDGNVDILSAITGGGINIFRGKGDGTLHAATTFSTSGTASGLTVGDTDGDGIRDISYLSFGFNVYKGKGDGTFDDIKSYNTGSSVGNFAYGDLDSDGTADVVGPALALANVFVLRATPSATTTLPRIDLTSRPQALAALSVIDQAMSRVSGELGSIGSTQSRISSALNTLAAARENSLAAAGRISDVDVASESAALTRYQILRQTAAAVLGQANLAPQLALTLLTR